MQIQINPQTQDPSAAVAGCAPNVLVAVFVNSPTSWTLSFATPDQISSQIQIGGSLLTLPTDT